MSAILVTDETGRVLREEQPLTDEQQAFVEYVYRLFEEFKTGNRRYLAEIRGARKVRELDDPEQDPGVTDLKRKSPQLNTLNSTIDNAVADFLDNMPEAVMTPETAEHAARADEMTDVVGWILQHAKFKPTWRRAVEDATVTGTGVLQVWWDDDIRCGGYKGCVQIEDVPPEDWLPDPLTDDFQEGRGVFKVSVRPLSYYQQHYPDEAMYIDPDADAVCDWRKRDSADDYNDPLVAGLEFWFKTFDVEYQRDFVHVVRLAGGALLEDSREHNPEGVYAHGRYPFAQLRFRERKSTAYGTGLVYEFADTQRMINRYMRYMDDNARQSSKQRLVVNRNAGVDMSQVTDYDADVIEADITDERGMNWQQAKPINGQVMSSTVWLQDTMKQDSGQNQFSRGEGGLGVTAASAINMLQEAGGKVVRMHTSAYMDSFAELANMVIALAAEFFGEERVLMITGREANTEARPVRLDGRELGEVGTFFDPAYSVRVNVQKTNPQQVSAWNQMVQALDQNAAAKGEQLPTAVIVRALQGVPNKPEMVKLFEDADAQRMQMQQMAAQLEQLAMENQQLQEGMMQAGQEIEAQKKMLGDASAMLKGAPQAPQMPAGAQQAPGGANPPTALPDENMGQMMSA